MHTKAVLLLPVMKYEHQAFNSVVAILKYERQGCHSVAILKFKRQAITL